MTGASWKARLLIGFLLLAGLFAAYCWLVMSWSYSSGERAGWVQKLSHKGWLCKTWEGELAMVSMPGSTAEKFFFTVHDDETAKAINRTIGRRVDLHYEEKVGIPTSCFGETRHFVTGVTPVDEMPLTPPALAPLPALPVAPAVPAAPAAARP